MASINFYLKKGDKKGDSPIMLTYQNRGQKFRYFTKLKIKPENWDNQRAKKNSTGFSEVNSILDEIEGSLKEIEREAIFNKKEFTVETIRRKFLLKTGALTNENNFFKIYDAFIKDSESTKTKGTIETYRATKHKLLSFSEKKNYPVSFDSVDQNFYETFLNYLVKDLGYLNNTVGKHIKTLKVFLNYAIDHEYCNDVFNLKKFKVFREEADMIYLTETELFCIYNLKDLPERLEKVKDIFCFSCFTGLRFSDTDKLRKYNIKDTYIEVKTEKTKDFIKVPLNFYCMDILKKYENAFPERPLPTGVSNQKTNEYLKEIGKIAGLNEMVCLEKFNGSNKITITKPKYELLSTHTARRTFVTLALEKGIRAEVVMAMTGHKNYKTFKKYIKITDKVMQQEMKRAWNTPMLKAV